MVKVKVKDKSNRLSLTRPLKVRDFNFLECVGGSKELLLIRSLLDKEI